MKVRMTIEIELSEGMKLQDDEERMWAENEIFIGDRELILHSNEIGDYIGEITKVSNLTWIEENTNKVIIIGGGDSEKATALALKHLDAGVTCLTVDEAKERGITITKDEIEPITMPIKISDYHLRQPSTPTRAERRKEARSKKRKKW